LRIFVAGQPLVAEVVRRGHEVTGMTHSEAGARHVADIGAAVANVSAFDAAAVEQALRETRAEVVIDELTSLPQDPSKMAAAAPGDRKLRIEGGGNLLRAAMACGVRRYIQQSSGFFLEPGSGLADESAGLAVNASPGVALSARTYADLEARVLNAGGRIADLSAGSPPKRTAVPIVRELDGRGGRRGCSRYFRGEDS
jgi:nucleoside-diphosphate-sugar epimerase